MFNRSFLIFPIDLLCLFCIGFIQQVGGLRIWKSLKAARTVTELFKQDAGKPKYVLSRRAFPELWSADI